MQTATCPPFEELKAYLSGKLDLDTSESLALHLQDCAHCGQTATQMEQEPDTLVELLQARIPPLANGPKTVHSEASGISSDIFPRILGQYELP